MTAQLGASFPDVEESDRQVATRDGSSITCRIYKRTKDVAAGESPLVVMLHGGGWCIGGLENEELLCRRLTSELGAVCVNVEYRLAPEYRFPTAVYDCHDAVKWVSLSGVEWRCLPVR